MSTNYNPSSPPRSVPGKPGLAPQAHWDHELERGRPRPRCASLGLPTPGGEDAAPPVHGKRGFPTAAAALWSAVLVLMLAAAAAQATAAETPAKEKERNVIPVF